MKIIWVLFFLPLLIGIPSVYAHPFLIDSEPPQASNVNAGLTNVIIHYSEAVEIDFSELKVFDANGNQIDNKDTRYHQQESSLIVTFPPLEDGVYTVSSKVLSKVDGHLVQGAVIFGVGDAAVDISQISDQSSESTFIPEAAARLPGLVGQTIVLGGILSSVLIWISQEKRLGKDSAKKIRQLYAAKFSKLTGIGIAAIFISNMIMLGIQTWRLETSPLDVLQTNFGITWLERMIVTIILLGLWFWMEKKKSLSKKDHIPLLAVSLVLIGTTTMMGHGAASETLPPIIIDYVHNLLSSVWIGGIIFLGFTVLPLISKLDGDIKEKLTLGMLPRFSMMIIISLGIVAITGPTLMWFLETDVQSITGSNYGQLIIAKILIALLMAAMGGHYQFKIQKQAEKAFKSGKSSVHKQLIKPLKIESILGVILLACVALLTNSALPAGDVQTAQAQLVTSGFESTLFSENTKFDVTINPVSVGANTIHVIATNVDGSMIHDLNGIKIKVSNPQRNIAPIEVPVTQVSTEQQKIPEFNAESTFGFAGIWLVEIEAQKTQSANQNVSIDLLLKPSLLETKFEIKEFAVPAENTAPLVPRFDGDNTIWISDASSPKLWKFTLDDQQFTSFEFDGMTTIFLDIDQNGKVWFTDTPNSSIGFFDPKTESFETIKLPPLDFASEDSIPIAVETDSQNNIWVAIVDKDQLIMYNQETKEFEKFIHIETSPAGPSALISDDNGHIWFAESQGGKIGVIDIQSGSVKEFMPEEPLEEPFALMFDDAGMLWIAEHTAPGLVRFDPVLESFKKVPAINPESLPFGMAVDKFSNIWYAEHIPDALAVYDPYAEQTIEIPLPSTETFTQFVTADNSGDIWFVEQRGKNLGHVSISSVSSVSKSNISEESGIDLKYAEIVTPFVFVGIILASLFYVKAVHDKRRIDKMLDES